MGSRPGNIKIKKSKTKNRMHLYIAWEPPGLVRKQAWVKRGFMLRPVLVGFGRPNSKKKLTRDSPVVPARGNFPWGKARCLCVVCRVLSVPEVLVD